MVNRTSLRAAFTLVELVVVVMSQGILAAIPPETLQDGDVLITNDPWIGTGHVYDVNIVKPIFQGGVLVGYALSVPEPVAAGWRAPNRFMHRVKGRRPLARRGKREVVSAGCALAAGLASARFSVPPAAAHKPCDAADCPDSDGDE